MSFRDFSPKQPSGGGGGGSGSRTPPRTQNNNSPFKRSSSNNTNTNNNKQRNPDLDSLQYSRSKSDSTYQNNFSPNYEENIGGMITFEPSSQQQYGSSTPSQQQQQQQQMTIQQSPSIQRREDEYALQVMQQREGEIRTIQQKMNVVNEIYKDLGKVVDEQSTQINNVEDTFNRSKQNTKMGLEQLSKANTKGSKKNANGGNSEEEGGDSKRKQFFLFKYIQKSANEISKMVSVCTGGSNAAASYTVDETWNKEDDNGGEGGG